MKEYGLNPGLNLVYNVRIEGLRKLKRTMEAKDLYKEMLSKGMKPNWVIYNLLIIGFCKEGMLDEAKRVYEEMGKKSVVSGEGRCSGSKSNEDEEEVEKAMRQMCGLGLGIRRIMQIHSSPSDQNLHNSWGSLIDDDDEKEIEQKMIF
ncbi:uncharacterized protein A4U43_C07F12760 [Asparagus officinalis]|uniref:Pentacotripeptide-repeat region of PRORP domain-containing protein n=1 Tax=Asparagus officinalis TaxID=4686 RepID=A0A5P1EBT2_ASPOF|nr:uncharacterized protein A4U43_C07F12760 [Asparagus officinalis]